jgi:hypothetical protein
MARAGGRPQARAQAAMTRMSVDMGSRVRGRARSEDGAEPAIWGRQEARSGRRPRAPHGWGSPMAEGTRLLSGRRSKAYRGFESLPLRRVSKHSEPFPRLTKTIVGRDSNRLGPQTGLMKGELRLRRVRPGRPATGPHVRRAAAPHPNRHKGCEGGSPRSGRPTPRIPPESTHDGRRPASRKSYATVRRARRARGERTPP